MRNRHMTCTWILMVALAAGMHAADTPELRSWTSAKGSKIEASLVRQSGSMVVLKSQEGKQIMIRLADISAADREYVKGVAEARRQAMLAGRKPKPGQAKTDGVQADYLSKTECEVIDEMNLARTDPAGYAKYLRTYLQSHQGDKVFDTPHGRIRTQEGVPAVEEAIAYLEKAKPVPPLKPSKGLSLAAKSHADDIGPAGITGHTGTKGSTMKSRINDQGQWQGTIGENIAFGKANPRGIVMQLIVDDGVPSRGHRTNIFKKEFKVVGVNIGSHKGYGSLCVMDYAGGFSD